MNSLPLIYQYGSRRKKIWKLGEEYKIVLSDGERLIIEEGFQTDLSSVPKWLWSIARPYGDFILASIVHDKLYSMHYKIKSLGSYKARRFADREMLIL